MIAYESPGLARLQAYWKDGCVFHASHAPDIEVFNPRPQDVPGRLAGIPGRSAGRRIRRSPRTSFTKSPEFAAIVTWGRSGVSWGFEYCAHPADALDTVVSGANILDGTQLEATLLDSTTPMPQSLLVTFYVASEVSASVFRDELRRALGEGLGAPRVYVFRPSVHMTYDSPQPLELISTHPERPIDAVPLGATDVAELARRFIPLDPSSFLYPVRSNGFHAPFEGNGACSLGGHLQYKADGGIIWPRSAPSAALRVDSALLTQERTDYFESKVAGLSGPYFE